MTAKPNSIVTIGKVRFGNKLPLALIAGPCALESRAHAFDMAGVLKELTAKLGIAFVYKTSFDKANRTAAKSARGLGLDKALSIFAELRKKLGVPVAHRCARARPMRGGCRGGRCSANPGVPEPANRSSGRGCQNRLRRQRQEGPVSCTVGYGQCRGQGDRRGQSQRACHGARRVLRLQYAGIRHARASGTGKDRRTCDL